MELGIDSIDDWNIKYRDTVARDTSGLVHLAKMKGDGMVDLYRPVNGSWVPGRESISDLQLDHTIPECGLINYKETGVHVFRTGNKQYRRGFTFSKEAFKHTTVQARLLARVFGTQVEPSAGLVQEIFDPVYYTPEGGLAEILQKRRIVSAITNRYYFAVSTYVPYIYLGYDDYIIGRVNESNATCRLFKSASPLAQDISQYIPLA